MPKECVTADKRIKLAAILYVVHALEVMAFNAITSNNITTAYNVIRRLKRRQKLITKVLEDVDLCRCGELLAWGVQLQHVPAYVRAAINFIKRTISERKLRANT